MIMMVAFRSPFLIAVFVCHLLAPLISSQSSDVNCLHSIRDTFQDPLNSLSNWDFSNNATPGFICGFAGIDCWHDRENRVLNIHLGGMGLRGVFPLGISGCSTMTSLDLSGNTIYGSIPDNISSLIGYVVTLDLSHNQFSGSIPGSLANCSYLNVLRLNNNQLSGQIPPQIGLLNRLTTFSVASNRLSGPVPYFINGTFPSASFADNSGLCGSPLSPCSASSTRTQVVAVVCGVVGAGILVSAVVASVVCYKRRLSKKKKEEKEDPLDNKWAKNIKRTKRIKLSMFEAASKMSLDDLMRATDNFSKANIIGFGRTGTMYKAVMEDGRVLMVKRLQDTQHSDKEFVSEMNTLGNVKHQNLVPLLGFCTANTERLLVYAFMPNGTLFDKLHGVDVADRAKLMNWPTRLKIGTRSAKGFAWLHHISNPRIIHRNISSSSILLDADYEPKISDFGLARLMNPIDTHLSTFVNGEFGDIGYVAPEYARTLVATPKGDVYSFGVVLLELVTREKPTYVSRAPESIRGNLVDWISLLSRDSKLHNAIDTALLGKGHDTEVFQVLKVACKCVLSGPKERPTMLEVYQLLRAIGQRYDFSTQDEMLMISDSTNTEQLVELIVARNV